MNRRGQAGERLPTPTVAGPARGALQRRSGAGHAGAGLTDAGAVMNRRHTDGEAAVEPGIAAGADAGFGPAQPPCQLRVGARDDPLEREADRVARQVMLAPAPLDAGASPIPMVRGGAPAGGAPAPAGMSEPPAGAAAIAGAIAGASAGASLAPAVRHDMERRFGHDFSRVRVHTDAAAQRSAAQLCAHAYTLGQSIVFGRGQYAPSSAAGLGLLAHELTHVVQQAGAPAGHGVLRRSERDPDEAAAALKEDQALAQRAAAALKSGKPDFAAHEVMWRLIKNYRLDLNFQLSGSRYDKAQQGVRVDMGAAPAGAKAAAATGVMVGGDDMLARVAKGEAAKVANEIAAQIGKVDTARGTVDYLFIMGADQPKTKNPFYGYAKKFFRTEFPGAILIEDVRDLSGINERINDGGKPVANLHIVSHAHPDGTLQFSLDRGDATPGQVQYSELTEANAAGALTQPKPDLLGFWTNVMIHGCNLGRNAAMLDEVKTTFGGQGRVMAPTHEQVYSASGEAMGGPFYEEPGKSALSDAQALKRIKAKPEYAFITDWTAMEGKLRRFTTSDKEIVYSGDFPEPGKEVAFLLAQPAGKKAQGFTFDSSVVEGEHTAFTYRSPDRFKQGDITITAVTPPSDADAIVQARAKVARPNAFAYRVSRPRQGFKLDVTVHIERTEWELYHAEMKKAGKGFNPSMGTPPWFGDTGY
ncbi:MAG: DUF4157 domain-containing protein [Pseudomonadota bacterium]